MNPYPGSYLLAGSVEKLSPLKSNRHLYLLVGVSAVGETEYAPSVKVSVK